jgi:translation initiation factor 3 subunit F
VCAWYDACASAAHASLKLTALTRADRRILLRPVQAGRREGDASVGRYLADTLAVVPRLEPSDFERMFNEGVQDDLLLSYFAHLVRSQVSLAERLGTAALPLI